MTKQRRKQNPNSVFLMLKTEPNIMRQEVAELPHVIKYPGLSDDNSTRMKLFDGRFCVLTGSELL